MTQHIHCAACGRILGRWTPATHEQPAESDVPDECPTDADDNVFCDEECENEFEGVAA